MFPKPSPAHSQKSSKPREVRIVLNNEKLHEITGDVNLNSSIIVQSLRIEISRLVLIELKNRIRYCL